MIHVNSVIHSISDNVFLRVLWLSENGETAYVIDMHGYSLPTVILVNDLETQLNDGISRIAHNDLLLRSVSEEAISEKDRLFRDNLWEQLNDLLDPQNEPTIFERRFRGKLLNEYAQKTGITAKTLYKHLKRYWQRGKNKNAFLPDHTKAGGKGTKKKSDRKLGRPPKYGMSAGLYIDEGIEKIFDSASRKYYHTKAEYTFKATYELMIRDNFSREITDATGAKELELLDKSEIPTLRQFRYWYSKNYSPDDSLRFRKGDSKYNLLHRALTGKSDVAVMGPGAKYQIDATVGDIYLVSQFNRADIIGRPIIYFIIDTFSRMITGMYVGLEGPSWLGAMMALANAASDKVKFCAEYGIEISEDDWPCHHIPEAILGDRGEMESKSADTLVNSLGVRIENAPPYRADIKGIVEQYFHTVNTTVTAFLPGNVKPDMSERVGRDYRLDAKLDLRQFTKVIIECLLYHNNEHYMENFDRSAEMISGDVAPIPIRLWNWGIAHYSGLLRSFPEDIVKLCLMPTDTAMVTPRGIRFKGIYYMCELAVKQKWLETARTKGNFKADISYDPRDMAQIYLRNTDGISYEVCYLADWQEKYSGKYLYEILYLQETEKIAKHGYASRKLTARVNLSAKVDEIVAEAEEQAKQTPLPKSKSQRTGNIRGNRKNERESLRREEAFKLANTDEIRTELTEVQVATTEEESPYLALIRKNVEERRHD